MREDARVPGRKPRLRRIIGTDGRTLIVAMDHLSRLGRNVRLRDPAQLLRQIRGAGADAALLRPGPAGRCATELGHMGLILSISSGVPAQAWGVEFALRLGADAVKIEAFPGADEDASRALLGPLAAECEKWAMPLIAEMIPVSFDAVAEHTPAHIADAARLGADLGADVVKTKFTGDVHSFADVVALAGVPVLILGGSQSDERSLLKSVREALDAGAAGAAVGRLIWNSDRPERIVGALARLIHEDATLDAAVAELSRTISGPAS